MSTLVCPKGKKVCTCSKKKKITTYQAYMKEKLQSKEFASIKNHRERFKAVAKSWSKNKKKSDK